MSDTENVHLASLELWRDDVVEYGPEVPLAVRLEHELMHTT